MKIIFWIKKILKNFICPIVAIAIINCGDHEQPYIYHPHKGHDVRYEISGKCVVVGLEWAINEYRQETTAKVPWVHTEYCQDGDYLALDVYNHNDFGSIEASIFVDDVEVAHGENFAPMGTLLIWEVVSDE
jgi:hypothetical protein